MSPVYLALGIAVLLLITIIALNKGMSILSRKDNSEEALAASGILKQSRTTLFTLMIVSAAIFVGGQFLAGSGMEAHIMDWMNLLVRWIHVVFGIAWIGASFYFIFLENSLNRTENLRDELAGNLWAIHGGGFYYVEKYKTAPGVLPKTSLV